MNQIYSKLSYTPIDRCVAKTNGMTCTQQKMGKEFTEIRLSYSAATDGTMRIYLIRLNPYNTVHYDKIMLSEG